MFALGVKSVSMQAVLERLVKHKTNVPMDNDDLMELFSRQEANRRHVASKSGVYVPGVETMKVSLASCCTPVPGDEISGYVSKGQGVKVHRKDCPNIQKEKNRLIDVYWDEEIEQKQYEVKLLVRSMDRNFLLSDIVTVVSQCKAGLNHVDSKVNDDKITATTKMTVVVENARHLQTLIANLRKINSVMEVERVIQ